MIEEDTGTWLRKMKSEKEWSLKDKQFMVDDGYALLSLHDVEKDGLYDAKDIETLRKKLIEDLEPVGYDILNGDCCIDKIEEIINRRFGIE